MQAGKYYHIYDHANGSENLFLESENYRWFLQQYFHFITPVAETMAYCLMPNHFHFLIHVRTAADLLKTFPKFETLEKLEQLSVMSKQFSNLFSSYTQAFNKKYQRRGSLFMKNFKRKEIESDHHLSQVIAYIHLNPVHHTFVPSLGQWPWTSYTELIDTRPTDLDREGVYKWFGSRNEFINHHDDYIEQKFQEISELDRWFKPAKPIGL